MNEWLEFVSTHTPTNTNARLTMAAMQEHQLLRVTGRDSVTFLQGQLTCDLRRLEQQEVLFGAHCNAKGRMISSVVLARTDETAIGLRLRANIAEPALAALKKYIVFSKATIAASDQVAMALLGDITAAPSLGELPESGCAITRDGLTLLHHRSGLLEIWATPARAMTVWEQLLPVAGPADTADLNRHWVEQGIAEVQAATAEEFIPQMLNYHLIDGISFKKGCYTGQEIVARMQYRGQLKKHTYRIASAISDGPVVGEELVSASDPEKTAATVVAGANGPAGWTGLVVTTSEIYAEKTALMEKNSGVKFEWATLPYAIP
jgi:folate-binding protein YgfZ